MALDKIHGILYGGSMLFERKMLLKLQEEASTKEIIVMTGMRRVGKTTLFRILFDWIKSDNKVFLDLENPLEQKIFEEKDYNNIWANLKSFGMTNREKAYIFLDEIQASPETVKAVKYLYDHYDVKFFITCSSSFYLKNLFPESLAGRKIILELNELDFEEFLAFKNKKKEFEQDLEKKVKKKNEIEYETIRPLYDEYLNFGGFPQVALEENQERKREHLKDIFKSYFEKDVQKLADFRDVGIFRDLLLLLLNRVGSRLDISKLCSEIGISRQTVYSYVVFLSKTYMIELVPPYTKNPDREISLAKKVYVCDNGFANLFGRNDEGAMLENAVFRNLKKYGKICYYQKRSGVEIDFILPEVPAAIEVKNRAAGFDLKKTNRIADEIGIEKCYVAAKEFSRENGFIPAQDI